MSRTAHRIVEILTLVASKPEGMSTSELASCLGTSRHTVFRLLEALRDGGFVRKDAKRPLYRVGPRLYELSAPTVFRDYSLRIVRRGLVRFVLTTKRPVDYAVLDGVETWVIERMTWLDTGPITLPRSLRAPWHLSATGRVMVAFSSEATRERLLSLLQADKTIDRGAIAEDLEATRRRGFAVAKQLLRPSHWGLAVPLLNSTGFAFGSLAIPTAPEENESGAAKDLIEELNASAAAIADHLGYAEDSADLI